MNESASKPPEPTVHDLMSEPIVRLVMQADKVDEGVLRSLLERMAANIRNYPPQRSDEPVEMSPSPGERSNFRLGVGIMLMNEKGQIFVGQRIDMTEEAWQMPQGGIDAEETPEHAALRELREELGTSNVEIVTSADAWLQYELPHEVRNRRPIEHWSGQRQKWFLMKFRGKDSDINVATEHPEFSHWRWVSARDLVRLIVPFKRSLYVAVLEEFAAHIDDRPGSAKSHDIDPRL